MVYVNTIIKNTSNNFSTSADSAIKGFYHKSKKSLHKKGCPNKGGEEKYKGRTPYDAELELTFKCRQRIEVEMPQKVVAMAREQQECEQAVEQLELQEWKEGEKEEEVTALDVGSGEKKMYDPAEEEDSEET